MEALADNDVPTPDSGLRLMWALSGDTCKFIYRNNMTEFLEDVENAQGALHVSLDVDFLDPSFAPAVGTTVPGGATIREAHLVMEMICDSDLMTSLDLVELNPFLDDRGRTAQVMVDLAASALGRRVFDRVTHARI